MRYRPGDLIGDGAAIKPGPPPQKVAPQEPPVVTVNVDLEKLARILADPLARLADATEKEIVVESRDSRRLVPWDVEILRDGDGNIKKLRLTPVL